MAIDGAATRTWFKYEETDTGIRFFGNPPANAQCIKMAHWRTLGCRMYRKYERRSYAKATAEGEFEVKVIGWGRRTQRPTFTARSGGTGRATCWRSRVGIRGLYFECDGSVSRTR